MAYDITCFGSSLVDIFVYTDIPDNGRTLSYPVGEKIQIKNIDFDIGGGGINTSTTFSRFGLKTALICNPGKDEFKDKILQKLKKEKITFLGEKNKRTGYSIVLDSKGHDRTILAFKGANDTINIRKNPKTKWLYFSALQGKSFNTQLKLAKTKKYKIAYNPSQYLFGKVNVKEIVKHSKILILNKQEAQKLGKKQEIMKLGPEILIITDGKEPFFCHTKEKTYKIYPHKAIKIKEKTGAGDAFASGFVASYIKTKDIKKSIQIGVANSESVVQNKGSTNIILSWKKAIEKINKSPCKIEEIK